MEYSVLLVALVLAFLAVQTSLRRAVSYRWRDSVDTVFGSGRQYEPHVTTVTGN